MAVCGRECSPLYSSGSMLVEGRGEGEQDLPCVCVCVIREAKNLVK